MGGPEDQEHQRGGDGALSAVLHDMVANAYHRSAVPNSAKHVAEFLTYSSLSQVCKYANRVSYEVLAQSSRACRAVCRRRKTAWKRCTGALIRPLR